jgi:hypothetical protein
VNLRSYEHCPIQHIDFPPAAANQGQNTGELDPKCRESMTLITLEGTGNSGHRLKCESRYLARLLGRTGNAPFAKKNLANDPG